MFPSLKGNWLAHFPNQGLSPWGRKCMNLLTDCLRYKLILMQYLLYVTNYTVDDDGTLLFLYRDGLCPNPCVTFI